MDSRENAQRAKEPILPTLHMSPSTRHTMRLLHSETVLTRKENAAKLLVSTKNCQRSPCEDALQDRELDGVPLWIEWSKSHVPQARMLQDFK